jgi:hypothetical protein
MKKLRVNAWAVKRVVDPMSIHSTEDQVRARARECCVSGSSHEFIQAAEDAAVRYFRRIVPAGRVR